MRLWLIGIVLFIALTFIIYRRNKKEYVSFSELNSNTKFYKRKWFWKYETHIKVLCIGLVICGVGIALTSGVVYLLLPN